MIATDCDVMTTINEQAATQEIIDRQAAEIEQLRLQLAAIPALVEQLLDDAGYIGRTYSPKSRHQFMRRLREELASSQPAPSGR